MVASVIRSTTSTAPAGWYSRVTVVACNLAGSAFAVYLLVPNLQFFLRTHAPMAAVFVLQQTLVGLIFLIRPAPISRSRYPLDWAAAYGGWLTALIVRAGSGYHVPWSGSFGLGLQLVELALWFWAMAYLRGSYGIAPANRGLVTGGPYRFVRHPLYVAYAIGGFGFLLQALSLRNVLVYFVTIGFQVIRVTREERHLKGPEYASYKSRVRWRLVPGAF